MTQTALILGANGRFGGHAAAAFEAAGWTVRRFNRKTDTLDRAGEGADVIVNAWNPLYSQWPSQLPGLHADVRRVALQQDATVIVPGNVYVFGEGNGGTWSADTPHKAQNTLGRLRREMEAAYRNDGVKTILLRCGDFLDDAPSGNWFDKVMVPGLPKGRLVYPGRIDADHAWAYLPDAARAAQALAETRESLPRYADIPFLGYTLTGAGLAQALGAVMGRAVTARPFNWPMLRLAQPFWPEARYLREMRYLWDMPQRLDGAALERLLPGFRPTDPREALRAATAHLR